VARWTLSVQPTRTPRAGPSARSVPSSTFIGPRSANNSVAPASLCVGAVTMRRGAPAYPASTQQILELRDQGLSWAEIAEMVGMTRSGAWSRYRRARQPKPSRLGRWQQVLADGLDKNLAIGVRAAVADHLGRASTRAGLNAARRAAHSLAALGHARVLHVPAADADATAGDRTSDVLANHWVIDGNLITGQNQNAGPMVAH